jgi:predicted nucleic acid-binding protein
VSSYADSNLLIRFLEGDAATRAPIEERFSPLRGAPGCLVTSRLARMECRVKHLRDRNDKLLDLWDQFFASPEFAPLVELTSNVVELATELRAADWRRTNQKQIRVQDFLHLAAAIVVGSDIFLTGDEKLLHTQDTVSDFSKLRLERL